MALPDTDKSGPGAAGAPIDAVAVRAAFSSKDCSALIVELLIDGGHADMIPRDEKLGVPIAHKRRE